MAEKKEKEIHKTKETEKPKCGIIMPISAIDSYSAEHWSEVKQILLDVIESVDFAGSLVSDAEETSIIQKTIVHNVYNNDIVICDVSGKNPNVMFELGMRLAFDKATIIVKDDITDYSFDTSPIEHLTYRNDLSYFDILNFKEDLKKKLNATYKKSKSDANYSTFLKSFGEFKIAQLESKEVSSDVFIIEALKEIKNDVKKLERAVVSDKSYSNPFTKKSISDSSRHESLRVYFSGEDTLSEATNAAKILRKFITDPFDAIIDHEKDGHLLILLFKESPISRTTILEMIRELQNSDVSVSRWTAI